MLKEKKKRKAETSCITLNSDGSLVICGEGCWLGVSIFCNEKRKLKTRAGSSLIFRLNESKGAARMRVSQQESQTDRQTDRAKQDGSSLPGTAPRMPAMCFIKHTMSWH